jgi:tetratricopeptide (TPR) repeat protein
LGIASINTAEEELEKFTELPLHRRFYLQSVLKEFVVKQSENLRSVGRGVEAKELLENYITLLFEEWEKEPDNPRHLASVANVAIELGSLEYAQRLLQSAISRAQSDSIPIDLAVVYFHLGRIHHYLRRDTSDELWCYEMAIQSQAPNNCRYPASLPQKIRAYFFAYGEAAVKGKRKHEKWYKKRAQELAPDVDWEKSEDITRFLLAVSDSEKQQVETEYLHR